MEYLSFVIWVVPKTSEETVIATSKGIIGRAALGKEISFT